MIFSSSSFFLFFVILISLYAFSRSSRQRRIVLLSGSLFFYASWKPAYLILLLSALCINYAIYNILIENKSRLFLVIGVALNLSLLGYYKYLGFFLETAFMLGRTTGVSMETPESTWINVALPLGISFFTFQMMSALIDVYRGEWRKKISFLEWSLYVSFFPQLIAGPIVRAHELVRQLENLNPITLTNLRLGCAIFLGGLVKKLLLADNLAPLVDSLYSQPQNLDFFLAWLATIAFALQIYFDFSGYSEMAIGLAMFFGVKLPRNFMYPYYSRNISEFWRRWHITLSYWLRDYLYISLGGSKSGRYKTMRNLLITMLLGGLWHGAGTTFLFWGGLHGFYLVLHRVLLQAADRLFKGTSSFLSKWLSMAGVAVTLFFVLMAWVFFRVESFDDGFTFWTRMLGIIHLTNEPVSVRFYMQIFVGLCASLIAAEPFIVGFFQRKGIDWWWNIPFPVRGTAYAGIVLLLTVFGGNTQKFIYFDF